MQLAGPHVFGPPADRGEAIAVLREAVALGITHIDTSDYYGPTSRTRSSGRPSIRIRTTSTSSPRSAPSRDSDGGWLAALRPEELRRAGPREPREPAASTRSTSSTSGVGGLDAPEPGSLEEPFTALAEMQQEGLIRHLGLSTVDAEQVAEAQSIAPIVCVQNFYNVAHRTDDELIESLAAQGIAYVPYFPLGGFSPLQSDTLRRVADRLDATPMAVALAWLLQRSPNLLLIPGTSSRAHLRENVAGAGLELSDADVAELDGIAAQG